jgi:hypothetical protein
MALLHGATALSALVLLAVLLRSGADVHWTLVIAFGASVVLGENTSVFVGSRASVSPAFMIVMAAVVVLGADDAGGAVAGAALVGMCSGLYLQHIRERRFSLLAFNCGQELIASATGAFAYVVLSGTALDLPGAAVGAVVAYAAVNIGFVLPGAALEHGSPARAVWADMRPAVPNYLAFGLLGVLVGQVGAGLGAIAVLLLAVPMVVGRWTFRSFERTRDAHEASIRLFIRLIEAKDPYTAGHTERVAVYSCYIAEELGLPPERVEHLRRSALMHDVGKLAVPSRLLNKPGRLTAHEWEVVRRHNDAGIKILGRIDFMRDMAMVASDRAGHYEADASGFSPDLVLEAHIVAVADAFDAMTSTRSYRRALDQDVAFEELRAGAGTQFNPACVSALVAAIERRGERFGRGHERTVHPFSVPPPETGVGSAGLGHLSDGEPGTRSGP